MTSGLQSVPTSIDEEPSRQPEILHQAEKVEKGLFYPSLLEELLPAFQKYLTPRTLFLDLGSGDGRVVFLAAALGAEAHGIEYESSLFSISLRASKALADVLSGQRVRLRQGDFFHYPWSQYDVIFYFDLGTFDRAKLINKLRAELKVNALLIVAREARPFERFLLIDSFPYVTVYKKRSEEDMPNKNAGEK